MTPPPRERWTPAYDRMFKMDHELAYGPTCPRFAWLDLCHNARWEDGTRIVDGVVIPLKRGEVLASLRWMAQRWEWSVKKVRSFVNLLTHPDVAKLEIIRETPQGTVYRIVNYDTYANPGHTAGHSKEHDRGTPGAHPGHKEQQGSSGFIKEQRVARALDDLGRWVGEERNKALGQCGLVDESRVRNTLYQHYGPPGLRAHVWRLDDGSSLAESERPRLLTAALTGYAAEGHTEIVTNELAGMLRSMVRAEAKAGDKTGLNEWLDSA